MKHVGAILTSAFIFAGTGAYAQTSAAPEQNTTTETPVILAPDSQDQEAPLSGENSFTESQAKARIEDAGYTEVSTLKLSDDGIWQGSAMRDGVTVMVSLDYKGNVTSTMK